MRVRERTADDDLVPLLLRVHARDSYPVNATPEQATAFRAAGRRVAAWVAEQHGRLVGHVALHHDPGCTSLAAVALSDAEDWTRLTDLHGTYDGVVLDLRVYPSPTPTS